MASYKYTIETTTGSNPADTRVYCNIMGTTGTTGQRTLSLPSGKKEGITTVEFDSSSKDGDKGNIGSTKGIRIEIPHDCDGGWELVHVTIHRSRDGQHLDTAEFSGPQLLDSNIGQYCVYLEKL